MLKYGKNSKVIKYQIMDKFVVLTTDRIAIKVENSMFCLLQTKDS